jgi:hypothetical protein
VAGGRYDVVGGRGIAAGVRQAVILPGLAFSLDFMGRTPGTPGPLSRGFGKSAGTPRNGKSTHLLDGMDVVYI